MKRLWFALILLAALCGASLANGWYLGTLSRSFTSRLEEAQELARQSQWKQADQLTHQVYESWQEHHFYLHTVLRHADTDQILRAFRSVLADLDIQELDQYAAANTDLITEIQLLAEMEQASLVNIF